MKYLLVNEPETCGKCEMLFELYWDRTFTTYCGRLHKEVLPWSKCEECPLKELPEKMHRSDCANDEVCQRVYCEFEEGYNACLEDITGETE